MHKPIAFGSDPETFVVSGDGTLSTPVDLIAPPKQVMLENAHGGYNRDGIALELNPRPSANPKEVAQHMMQLLADGSAMLARFGLTITNRIGADLKELPPMARVILPGDCFQLGCDPDFNAYTKKVNHVRVNPTKYTKRFCGGHISVQIEDKITFTDICELVRMFDRYAGLHSLKWSATESVERRKTYGKAGCFRWRQDKNIIEYRTPDAGWLWHDGYEEMCDLMTRAYHEWKIGIRLKHYSEIVQAINTCNKSLANALC